MAAIRAGRRSTNQSIADVRSIAPVSRAFPACSDDPSADDNDPHRAAALILDKCRKDDGGAQVA